MLRRLILLAALAVSGLFLVGASPASAANCTISVQGGSAGILWQNTWFPGGDLYYVHYAHACTDVDLVEFSPKLNGTGATVVGIVDRSDGLIHYTVSPPTLLDVLCGRTGIAYTDSCGWTGHVPVYCGHLNHIVYTTSQFRIHGLASKAWGPWHGVGSSDQLITC